MKSIFAQLAFASDGFTHALNRVRMGSQVRLSDGG